MQALSVVVFQSDPRLTQALAATLSLHYHQVHAAGTLDELRIAVRRNRAEVAILDVETSSLSEVQRLHREFPGLSIVCTHRVADEEMWAAALNAGASDMCPTFDTNAIVMCAERSVLVTRPAA